MQRSKKTTLAGLQAIPKSYIYFRTGSGCINCYPNGDQLSRNQKRNPFFNYYLRKTKENHFSTRFLELKIFYNTWFACYKLLPT